MPARPAATIESTIGRTPWWAWLGLLLIVIAALWIHHGTLKAPFFADDFLFLEQVQGRSLPQALAAPDPIGNYFRPVSRQLWFWIMLHAGGGAPWLFHAKALGLFVLVIALLFMVVSVALGPRAALVAAALLALTHAADVPVLWASGAQDLLAVALALAALVLFQGRRPWLASLAFALALLSKETVLATPLIAAIVARSRGESLRAAARRAWPLAATLLAWGVVYVATLPQRAAFAAETHLSPLGALASVVQLGRTIVGFETPLPGSGSTPPGLPELLPVALVAASLAVVTAFARRASAPARSATALDTHAGIIGGLAWGLLGALPVAAVAPLWSAYYFLFAMCGVAFAIAAALRSQPDWAVVGTVALLGFGACHARAMDDFAHDPGMWTAQSHINQAYLERGMEQSTRYLAQLKRARPTVPRNTTLYFGGLPSRIAFQAANGPLLRWAYRDPTLIGRFVAEFRGADAARGPSLFFEMVGDSLSEVRGPDSLLRIAAGLMVSDDHQPAHDLLVLHVQAHPNDVGGWYALALTCLEPGDSATARAAFERSGLTPAPGPTPEIRTAFAAVTAGDTVRALALIGAGVSHHALDAGAHALCADLLLSRDGSSQPGALEAYAACRLDPDAPSVWRRWAMVQAVHGRNTQALASLDRYERLGGASASADLTMRQLRRNLETILSGRELIPAGRPRLSPP